MVDYGFSVNNKYVGNLHEIYHNNNSRYRLISGNQASSFYKTHHLNCLPFLPYMEKI